MKQLVIIMFFLSNVTCILGQITISLENIDSKKLPDKIKTIRRYHNDILLNVCTYDTLKNMVFDYYRQYHDFFNEDEERWLTMITAKIYNYSGKIEKSYSLHSNAGLSIMSYEYDSLNNKTRIYAKNNDYEFDSKCINTNSYSYISDIMNINDLVAHPKIMEIELTAKTSSTQEHTFDSVGNMTKQISHNEKGDTSVIQHEYDKYNNKVFSNYRTKVSNYEIYYEYEHIFDRQLPLCGFINDEQLENQPKPKLIQSNLMQSVRIDYDWREKRKRVSDNIDFFKYDEENRLIEQITYRKGELISKSIYEYNSLNLKTKHYFWYPNRFTSESDYTYDEDGNVIEERVKNNRGEGEYTIKYQYEYYE